MGLHTFLKINVSIVFISAIVYCIRDTFTKNCTRTILLMTFLGLGTADKPSLHFTKSEVQIDRAIIYLSIITLIDVVFNEAYPFVNKSSSLFPFILFVYEFIFDFFHYWSHRTCHRIPFLYKYIHKTHHKHHRPSILSTFYMHPLDYILTNIVPHKIAMLVVHKYITDIEYEILLAYKVYIEIAGHSGVDSNSPSFPVFPTLFGFALQTKDHDLHHSRPDLAGNYSKRFRIWDRVFGTYIHDSETGIRRCAVRSSGAARHDDTLLLDDRVKSRA